MSAAVRRALAGDSELCSIRETLVAWAVLNRGYGDRALRYPSCSPEQRMIFGAGMSGKHDAEWPDDVIKAEKALTVVGLERKAYLDVIRHFYLYRMNLTFLADEMHLSWSEAKELLLAAEQRVWQVYQEIGK